MKGEAVVSGIDFGDLATSGCLLDVVRAYDMAALSRHTVKALRNKEVSKANLLEAWFLAIDGGDGSFFLYHSGHGTRERCAAGTEPDPQDRVREGIVCANDEVLWDDEIAGMLETQNHLDRRGIVMLDTCFGGGALRGAGRRGKRILSLLGAMSRRKSGGELQIIQMSAARETESADGYQQGGAFTISLTRIFADGKFVGNPYALHVKTGMELKKLFSGAPAPDYQTFNACLNFEEASFLSVDRTPAPEDSVAL